MESGPPWRDPRWGYGYGSGSAVQLPFQGRSDGGGLAGSGGAAGGGGGILKRSLTEFERQHQQTTALQQALLLRAVRQKTLMASPVSPLLSPSAFSGSDLGSLTSSSSFSSFNSGQSFIHRPQREVNPMGFSFASTSPPAPAPASNSLMKSRLQELERQLFCDDDEDEGSVSCSAMTNSEWSETMQQLIEISSPTPPPPATVALAAAAAASAQSNAFSPSPSNSCSSTASSSASYSPPSSTPSRQLLADTATAISDGNLETAVANLAVLTKAANPRGDSEQRLAATMVTALASRLKNTSPAQLPSNPIAAELFGTEQRTGTHLLHEISPCYKLGLLAANLAILDATRDCPSIHLVDFDLGSGAQLAALIQALGERRPRVIKITAVADPTSPFTSAASASLKTVGDRLKIVADRAAVDFRFNTVSSRVADLDHASLRCEPGETLVVNLAFVLSRVPDESVSPANPRDELLRRVRALGPCVVTLVEQEMNGNTAPFLTRFSEACGHYGALLDSIEATFGRDSTERARAELALARKAANSVAKEAAERVERPEVFGKWRARMGMAGLRPIHLESTIADSVRARLGSVRPNPGFTVKEEAGGLGFGWMGRVLTVTSAWH